MTDREKIIEVIKKAFDDCGRMLKEQIPRVLSGEIKKASDGTPPLDEAIADALIDAGIGDVKKTKHHAAVAERALNNTCAILCAQGVEYPYSDEEWQLQQAKKELAEEGKDE